MERPAPAPRLILPVLCICSFAVPFNNYILSPILVDLAADFQVSLATAGLLAAVFAIPASALSLVMGPLSDKYGRRPLLVFGVAALTASNVLSCFAWGFLPLAVFRVVGGIGTEYLSIVSGTAGAGVLLGGITGGRLADRWLGHKTFVIGTGFLFALLLVVQTNLVTVLFVAIATNLVMCLPMGARFTSMLTLLSEHKPDARGRLLALNTNGFHGGVVLGSAFGGQLIEAAGYGPLGWACAMLIVLSAVVVWCFVRPAAAPTESVGDAAAR